MYSMVMMMAVASSGDTASFGGLMKGGCSGNSCHGAMAAPASCHGGGLMSKIKAHFASKHSCHGSTSSGCHGAAAAAPVVHAAPVMTEASCCGSSAPVMASSMPVMMGGMVSDGCALPAMVGAPVVMPAATMEAPKTMPKAEEPKKEAPKTEEKKKES
jgi:hypothetical protein